MTVLTSVEDDYAVALDTAAASGRVDEGFIARAAEHFAGLRDAYSRLFGDRSDAQEQLAAVVAAASTSWNARSLELRVGDSRRVSQPEWLHSERMLGGSCYVDRFAGNLAGVSDQIPYLREAGITLLHLVDVFVADEATDADHSSAARRVNPSLGTAAQLDALAGDLRLAGIALALDLPGEHADLASPDDFLAAAIELLRLANQGVDVVRFGAAAPAPDALQALTAVLALAAPGTAFAVDHGAQGELVWDALATRDGRLLQRELDQREPARSATAWTNAVRARDDLGWSFSDEDAASCDIDAGAHRQFLTDFYTGAHEGSFARGLPSGTSRVAGTTASLAGVESGDTSGEDRVVLAHALMLSSGGIPQVWLGDEVAQLNDYSFTDDPERRHDAQWVHRGNRPRDQYARRDDESTPAGRIFHRLRALFALRQRTPEFAGTTLIGFHTPHAAVVGFQRPGPEGSAVLVLANVGDDEAWVDATTLSGFEPDAVDLIHRTDLDLTAGLTLPPHACAWVRVTAR